MKKNIKDSFGSYHAEVIFKQCVITGSIKIQGKEYAISHIDERIDIPNELSCMRKAQMQTRIQRILSVDPNPTAKDEQVIAKVKNNQPVNVEQAFLSFLKVFTVENIYFSIQSVDDNKVRHLVITPHYLFETLSFIHCNKAKEQFKAVVTDPEFHNCIDDIDNDLLETFIDYSQLDFLTKSYAETAIKMFMLVIGVRNYNGIIIERIDGIMSIPRNFMYADEVFTIEIGTRRQQVSISFKNGHVSIIKGLDEYTKGYLSYENNHPIIKGLVSDV